jgi:hypothetical protein
MEAKGWKAAMTEMGIFHQDTVTLADDQELRIYHGEAEPTCVRKNDPTSYFERVEVREEFLICSARTAMHEDIKYIAWDKVTGLRLYKASY